MNYIILGLCCFLLGYVVSAVQHQFDEARRHKKLYKFVKALRASSSEDGEARE